MTWELGSSGPSVSRLGFFRLFGRNLSFALAKMSERRLLVNRQVFWWFFKAAGDAKVLPHGHCSK